MAFKMSRVDTMDSLINVNSYCIPTRIFITADEPKDKLCEVIVYDFIKHHMDKIYKECGQLKTTFIEQEFQRLPSYCFTYIDGDKYVNQLYYDNIIKEANKYYEKCLEERTVRVPKSVLSL